MAEMYERWDPKKETYEEFQNRVYPELRKLAKEIAKEVAIKINTEAPKLPKTTPYRQQYVLEEVIRLLEDKV